MEAKELRVGNLVDYAGTVHIIGPGDFQNAHLYRPIHLTEPRIRKLGFNHAAGSRWQLKNLHGFDLFKAGGSAGSFSAVKNTGENSYYIIVMSMLFVHQLQNLYFAFTGQC